MKALASAIWFSRILHVIAIKALACIESHFLKFPLLSWLLNYASHSMSFVSVSHGFGITGVAPIPIY
jgi:hypothetical protein